MRNHEYRLTPLLLIRAPAAHGLAAGYHGGREVSRESERRRIIAALFALNCLALTACAHGSMQSAAAFSTKEPKDMTSSDTYRPSPPAEHPDLTPEEVGRRVLRLLDGLKSTDQLTLDEVAAKTGLPLKYAPKAKVNAFTIQIPDSPWFYGVTYSGAKPPKAVELQYAYKGDTQPAGTPLCGIKFDDVAKKLKADGFLMRIDVDELGQPLAYTFRRERVDVQVVLGANAAGKHPDTWIACVGQLMITSAD